MNNYPLSYFENENEYSMFNFRLQELKKKYEKSSALEKKIINLKEKINELQDIILIKKKKYLDSNIDIHSEKIKIKQKMNKLNKQNIEDKLKYNDLELDYIAIDIIQKEEKKKGFSYYPTIEDLDFNTQLLSKTEFRENKETKNNKETQEFELLPSQRFLKNYISPYTPYNGVLLFHGTGVGKTCSAISIAEQFIPYIKQNNNKIIVLANGAVQDNFKKELFNIDNFMTGNYRGCVGLKYAPTNNSIDIKKKDEYIKISNHLIHENYSFYGYIQFANEIDRIENEAIKYIDENDTVRIDIMKRNAIKNRFSNTVIIIDEAHHIKLKSEDNDVKKVSQTIEKVLDFSVNNKLILMTATPMFDNCREIVFLLKLLLLNDKRELIDENEIFDLDDHLTEKGRYILINKSKGYISFIRGQSTSFPKRLYPDDERILTDMPKYDVNRKKIKKDEKIKYLKLVSSELKDYQYKLYSQHLDKNQENSSFIATKSLQYLNFCFPEDSIGNEGIKKCFDYKNGKYKYKHDILKKYKHFLKEEHIHTYSTKFKTILEYIKNSTGIVFIYSEFIDSGALPLALFLEQNGYLKYNNNGNVLETEKELVSYDGKLKKNFKNINEYQQGHYICLIGSGHNLKSDNQSETILAVNNKNNKYGEKIKIIIASKAAGEGLDFKRIREVHILDPWYNLNKIEQAIGRSIRNKSHIDLKSEEQNTTVFMHVTLNPKNSIDKDTETYDIRLYRQGEIKQFKIALVEYELKVNSFNCYVTKDINMKLEDDISIQRTSQNKLIEYNSVDKPHSAMCNFRDSCYYTCFDEENIKNTKENMDTYDNYFASHHISNIKKNIKYLYTNENYYKMDDIYKLIRNISIFKGIKDTFLILFINISIDEMIKQKDTVLDKFKREGHIIYKNGYYIFNPIENDIFFLTDTILPKTQKKKKFLLVATKKKQMKKDIQISKDIKKIIDDIIKTSHKKYDSLHSYWKSKDKDIVQQIIIEQLIDYNTFNIKKDILEYLVKHYNIIEEYKYLFKAFEYNFIYNKDNDIYGFLIKNTNNKRIIYRYIKKENKFYEEKQLDHYKHIKEEEKKELSPNYGFLDYDNIGELTFKFLNDVKLNSILGKGKRCMTYVSTIIKKTIHKVIKDDKYVSTNKNNKFKKVKGCYELEFIFRYLDKYKIDNYKWFDRNLY